MQRAYAKSEPYASRPAVTEEGKKILLGQTAQATQLTVNEATTKLIGKVVTVALPQ